MMTILPWLLVAICICAEIYSIRVVGRANRDLVATRRLLAAAETQASQLRARMQDASTKAWDDANARADRNIAVSDARAALAEIRADRAEAQIRHSEDSSRRHEFAAKAFEAAARGWHEYAKAVEALHTLETDERRT